MNFLVRALLLSCVIILNNPVNSEEKSPDWQITVKSTKELSKTSFINTLSDELDSALKKHRKQDIAYKYYSAANHFIRADKKFIKLWLESKGFYSASILSELKDENIIQFTIEPGQQYKVVKVSIEAADTIKIPSLPLTALVQGGFLIAGDVLTAKKEIAQFITENNCLFNVKVDYQAIIATEEKQAELIFNVMDSPQVRYGEVSWRGLTTVKDSVIEKQLRLEKNTCFKRTELDQQRVEFLKTNLLANVQQQLTLDKEKHLVNIRYQFTEAQHKTVKAGIAMVTDEGVELSGSWENRNMFGSGERLTVDAAVSPKSKKIKSELEFPQFYSEKNNLLLNAEIEDLELEAYDSRGISLGAHLRRVLTERSYGQAGVKYKHTELTRQNISEKFDIVSFPLSYVIDTTKNPLDPRNGAKAKWLLEHFTPLNSNSTDFTKFEFSVSGYKTAKQLLWQPTLAVKLASGLISSVDNPEILPANELYYVGGGGSVRGYPYQTLGPLYEDNKPAGGLSFAEASLEGRFHLNDQWGFVVFTEGGSAFSENTPAFDSRWKWAVGMGARYYTGFAPMRVDLAFPLSKRAGIDDSFQLYISIGEAF